MMRAFLLVLLAASPVLAEDPPDRPAAEQHFRIGADAFRAKQYAAAASNFDRAYELFAAPEIAFSAAQAHRLQFAIDSDPARVDRAIALYELYLAKAPAGPKVRDARAHLERMREVHAKLQAAGPRAAPPPERPAIYVSVALETALVTVDGKAVERYQAIAVEPGEHTVVVSADGHVPVERKVTVAKGQAMVPIELAPKPAMLALATRGDAKLVVDGRPVARAPVIALAPGKRLVTVYARGREPVTRELDLQPGQELALDVPLRPTTRRRAVIWAWLGTGALAAVTIASAAVAIDANGKASDLRDSTTALDAAGAARYEQLRGRRDDARTTSLVLGGATLLAAGTALWLYYADLPSPDDLARPVERPREGGGFTPVVFADGAGLGYAGAF